MLRAKRFFSPLCLADFRHKIEATILVGGTIAVDATLIGLGAKADETSTALTVGSTGAGFTMGALGRAAIAAHLQKSLVTELIIGTVGVSIACKTGRQRKPFAGGLLKPARNRFA